VTDYLWHLYHYRRRYSSSGSRTLKHEITITLVVK
jgi:hypothetical protein